MTGFGVSCPLYFLHGLGAYVSGATFHICKLSIQYHVEQQKSQDSDSKVLLQCMCCVKQEPCKHDSELELPAAALQPSLGE